MAKRRKLPGPKWLSRELIKGPYLMLVMTEKAYLREMRRLGIKDPGPWLGSHADGTTAVFSYNGQPGAVVSVCPESCYKKSMTEVAGLLVHEAVHVFQGYCKYIGESDPSDEFMAYSIQHIVQQLIASFRKQSGLKD